MRHPPPGPALGVVGKKGLRGAGSAGPLIPAPGGARAAPTGSTGGNIPAAMLGELAPLHGNGRVQHISTDNGYRKVSGHFPPVIRGLFRQRLGFYPRDDPVCPRAQGMGLPSFVQHRLTEGGALGTLGVHGALAIHIRCTRGLCMARTEFVLCHPAAKGQTVKICHARMAEMVQPAAYKSELPQHPPPLLRVAATACGVVRSVLPCVVRSAWPGSDLPTVSQLDMPAPAHAAVGRGPSAGSTGSREGAEHPGCRSVRPTPHGS